MKTSSSHLTDELTEEDIIDYLKAHPDFFCQHSSLLEHLTVPHAHPKETISLVEHQLLVFRHKIKILEQDLRDTLSMARKQVQANNQIKQFILELIECDDIPYILETVDQILRQFLSCQAINLFIPRCEKYKATLKNLYPYQSNQLPRELAQKLSSNPSVLSAAFKLETLHFLFDGPIDRIFSAVIAPIGHRGCLGLIAIGYAQQVDDIELNQALLSFIAQVLERIIPKYF